MAKKINFETQVVAFYGVSQEGSFIVGKPVEKLLGVVKFENESDYNFFKKCFKGFMNGVLYSQNIVNINTVQSYKKFRCNKFTETVVNSKVLA